MYDDDFEDKDQSPPAKRKAGEYEITHAIRIGDKEVVFGQNETLAEPFFCALCETTQIAIYQQERYAPCVIGSDYIAVMEQFSAYVNEQCAKVRAEREQIAVPLTPITAEMCLPNDYSKSIASKVVAVKQSALHPEYQSAPHQLIYVTGGNGAQANAYGNACFHYSLYTGEQGRWERYDIQGEVKPEHLPDWAKTRLTEILKQEKQKSERKETR